MALNKKSAVYALVSVILSVSLTLAALEAGLRLFGDRFRRMAYDEELGWVPSPGHFESMRTWTSTVDPFGLRSNGTSVSTTGPPILAVGDSFTFGDEVEDDQSWPAYLEGILHKRVLNAGVDAYGIDQAVLRAERLLDKIHPAVVILAFISDDISRTEFSYYPYGRGWKPYFELEDGVLGLHNVPVPRHPPRAEEPLRRILDYSVLADTVFSRAAPQWWVKPRVPRVHHDGESVCVELLRRLGEGANARRARFLAVALATNGRIGRNDRLPSFVERAGGERISVLDLSKEQLALGPGRFAEQFRPNGHYAPEMNRWVAERVAASLQ